MNDALARKLLRGRDGYVSNPTMVSGAIGAGFGVVYGNAVLQLKDALSAFVVIVAVLTTLLLAGAAVRTAYRVRTLRGLGKGTVPLSTAALQAAARELHALPDFIFVNGLQLWVGGASLTAVLLKLVVPSVEVGTCLRIVFIAVLFGPVSSLFAYFLVLPRARAVLSQLAELGLTAHQLIEAVPPTRRNLRLRLVLFTAVSVVAPAVLTADLSAARTQRGLEQVAAAPVEAQAELARAAQASALGASAVLGGVVLFLVLVTAFAAGTALGKPMREIADEARRIAAGKVRAPKVIPAEDEVWAVSAAFTTMQAHLAGVLEQLRRAGVQISSTTDQIVATSRRYEGGAAEQATSLNETSATTEELARSAAQIAENAGSVADIAQRTLSAAEEGQGSAQTFAASMARMRQDNEAINESVFKLSKRVQQIGRIVVFINGVADKSDLLALNAELEGTKAGEVGRGFQLVASEMRRLAENVIESTKEIEGLIEEIREATRGAVMATEAGMDTTLASAEVAASITDSLSRIVSMAQLTSNAVRAISLATQQQQSGTNQLAEAMADILRVTQQNLGATRQVTAVNVDLAALAKDLKTAVDRFEA